MDLTVDRLKIGAKLVLGKYGVQNEYPCPIVWLKATPNCDFITESVLDYLCFDAREPNATMRNDRYGGNPQFSLSNIFSFLNSDEESWYRPSHEVDAPPQARNVDQRGLAYDMHYGFLYHFGDYELDSMKYTTTETNGERLSSLIRLPMEHEIVGADRFKLFTRKGVRPNGTENMICGRSVRFDYGSYVDFWLSNGYGEQRVRTISRSGNVEHRYPKEACGVRPVCSLKADAVVVPGENDTFYIKPYQVAQNICTEEELLNFLGLAQP